jgi:hypothetical protein
VNSATRRKPVSHTIAAREAAEISEIPKVQRRVGGYTLDVLVPRNAPNNMAHLLVGRRGRLVFTRFSSSCGR